MSSEGSAISNYSAADYDSGAVRPMQHRQGRVEVTIGANGPSDGTPIRPAGAAGSAVAMAIATTAIAALQPVLMRYGALNIDPLLFCMVAVWSAAIAAAILLAGTGELALLMRPNHLARLALLSLTGTFATSLLLIYGLRSIDAVAGVILLESEPIYSLVLARIFLGERPALTQIAATAVILAGIGSVFGAGPAFKPLYAAGLVFVTPLFWQISHVISLRLMPPLRPLTVTGARYIFSAFALIITVLLLDRPALRGLADPGVLLTGGVTGGLVYFLGSLTWYAAINRLSLSWTTAFVIPGVPIMSFAFAMVFLGERPSMRELVGITVAIIGVVALVRGANASRVASMEVAEAAHQPLA
jgi:O-acetylserine/cysteine efflux transporter